jgi:tight adherence protein C
MLLVIIFLLFISIFLLLYASQGKTTLLPNVQMTSQTLFASLDKKIADCGGFYGLGAIRFMAVAVCLSVTVAVVMVVAFNHLGVKGGNALLAGGTGFVASLSAHALVLKYRVSSRKATISKTLPTVLEMLSISVQAGLSFDGAIAKIAEQGKGPLATELQTLLRELRMGVPRRNALKRLSKRCNVSDVALFTGAVVQAEQLGVSLGNMLEIQAKILREKRRQRIREVAMKIPVKMIFPLIFFIFPAMFVVLLAPAVIAIRSVLFSK